MAWLDDRAWCHPKLVNLSDRAHRVYVNSLSYSSGMGLGGTLTGQQQKLMGATRALRGELVAAGLWDERDEDIYIHDWDVHNGKRDARKAVDRERKKAARNVDSPKDSPTDVPKDTPQSRRALKEVTVVKEVTSVELANASPTAQQLVAEYVEAVQELGAKAESRSKGMVAQRIGQLLSEGHKPETISGAIHLMIDRRLHPSTLPTLLLEASAGPARKRRELSELDQDFVHFAGGSA